MNLPKIDISSLPDLEPVAGLVGSLVDPKAYFSDDSIIILMTFIYELLYP